MSIADSYNFRCVDDCLTTSGVVGTERLEGLAAQGYELLIDLLPADNAHAVADERKRVESQGLRYVHIPVDFAEPSTAQLEAFIEAIDVAAGTLVHAHCAANYRVSAFVAIHRVRSGRWTADQARDHIASLWNPADYPPWAAFINEQCPVPLIGTGPS